MSTSRFDALSRFAAALERFFWRIAWFTLFVYVVMAVVSVPRPTTQPAEEKSNGNPAMEAVADHPLRSQPPRE